MAQVNFNSLVEKMLELDKATKKTAESMDKLDKEFEQLSKQPSLKKNAEVLKRINTESVKLIKTEKELIKSRGQISKLNQKAIREADKITQSISLEAQVRRHNEVLLKKEISEKGKLIALEQRYGKVHKNSVLALQRRNNELVKFNKTLDVNSRKYKKNAQAILKNTNRLKRFDKAIGRSQRNVGNYGSSFRTLLGAAGLGTGIYGMIRALGNAIKIFKSFEKAGKKLQAILGESGKGVKILTDQAKSLGSVTAFTASEILGLHTELAKLGFTLPQIEASTKGILALAAATGTELSSAAELAGATIRIFGLDASEAGRVADVLALSTSKSALTMEKLSSALPIVGTTAKQAGLNLEQTTALLGTLSNRGIDASTSATALRNIFLELSKKGLTFNEAMEMINNSTDKSKTSMELFGKRAATAGVILAETGDITGELEIALNDASGAAQDMADVMLDNLAGDITIAKSAWEGFVLSVEDGDGVISTSFRNIIKFVTLLLGKLTELNRFGFAAAKNTVKIAEANVESWKKTIEFSSKAVKIHKLKGYLDKIESDILAEKNKRKELAGKLATKENRALGALHDEQVKRLKIERMLLIELGETDFFEGHKESIIENSDALEENKTALELQKEALEKQLQALRNSKKGVDDLTESLKGYNKETKEQVESPFFKITGEKGQDKEIKKAAADVVNKVENAAIEASSKSGKGGLLSRIFGFGKDNSDKIFSSLNMFADAFGTWIQNQIDKYDELINKQQDNINGIEDELKTELERIEEAKKAGQAYDLSKKKALEDQLKGEKAYLSASLVEQKKAKERQRKSEAAMAVVNIASAILNVWKDAPSWVTALIESAAITAIGVVELANINSARFAEGTESVQGFGRPNGIDTVPAMLTKNERVMTVDQNKAMPKGFKNDWIPLAAHYWLNKDKSNVYVNNNGEVVSVLEKIENNTSNNKVYGSDGNLKSEIKGNHIINYN